MIEEQKKKVMREQGSYKGLQKILTLIGNKYKYPRLARYAAYVNISVQEWNFKIFYIYITL